MSASALILLSYALLAISGVVFVLKSARMAKMPVHLRWELAPVPHEKGKGKYGGSYLEESEWWTKPREKDYLAEGRYMMKEILFLKALFEHKRSLWWFSFPFHLGLYLLVGAAALLVFGGIGALTGALSPERWILARGLPLLAGVGYFLGVSGALGLLVVRVTDKGMANSTSPGTYFTSFSWGPCSGPGSGRSYPFRTSRTKP